MAARGARERARSPRRRGRRGARRRRAPARRAPSSTQAASMKAWNRLARRAAGWRSAGGRRSRARGARGRRGAMTSGPRRAAAGVRLAAKLVRRPCCCWRRGWRHWRRMRLPRGFEEEVDSAAVEEKSRKMREDAESLRRRHGEPKDCANSKAAKQPRQQCISTPAGVTFCRDREARGSADAGADSHRCRVEQPPVQPEKLCTERGRGVKGHASTRESPFHMCEASMLSIASI